MSLEVCGLVINPKWPYIGASPDGRISCDCCGNVVLEIKCPYCSREGYLEETNIKDYKKFFMEKVNSVWSLKWCHPYYMQTQTHLAVSDVNYCDFIVFTCNEMIIECIFPDTAFFEENLSKVEKFMKIGILPEILGKCFSRIPIGAVNNNLENVDRNVVAQLLEALENNDTSSDDDDP